MNRYVCIHGHFYQPPRENPWLEEVELQDSAYPYHDWNERITAECYGANAASRILGADKTIAAIVNNYSRISFNFGPTLLSWMERHAPEVYQAILAADRESLELFSGHGSAIAQVYNHIIMPLANDRDKRTQVIWGNADFEHRFGRRSEGMWLAETAVDTATLEALADQGVRYTILAPHQAARVRRLRTRRWNEVTAATVDTRMPYICRLPSGKKIALFFYDGPIARDIAFGGLLGSGVEFANRLASAFDLNRNGPQLTHLATDGETYGHHHRWGDMALAYALHHLEAQELARLTVYGEFLAKHPPTCEVEIVEETAWSCAHGVERWRSDCGCNAGHIGWTQVWRGPLRDALNWLRDSLAQLYEAELTQSITDPWAARDDYIQVILDRSAASVARFFDKHARRELAPDQRTRVLRLLEMQRYALLMFTSCGWFFDEISGLETAQCLAYAARAIQLAEKTTGAQLETAFIELLRHAPSNVIEFASGADVYQSLARPLTVNLLRAAAHYAVSSLFEEYPETVKIYAYTATRESYERREAGRQRLAIGKARLRSSITHAEITVSFAVLHLGDHNLLGGVREHSDDESFQRMRAEITEAFTHSDLTEIMRLMNRHFETHNYSLRHLFRDEQRKVWNRILRSTLNEVAGSFRRIYDHHYPVMRAMREQRAPIPKALAMTAEMTIDDDLQREIEVADPDTAHISRLIEEVNRWRFDVDRTTLGFAASRRARALMEQFAAAPVDMGPLDKIESLLRALEPLALEYDLAKVRNLLFLVGKRHLPEMRRRADAGETSAEQWIMRVDSLSDYLRLRSA